MKHKVLAPLERLDAVDRDLQQAFDLREFLGLDQETVTTEPRDLVRDRRRTAPDPS